MSTKIDLPGGGWAEIKDPDELTNRDRKLLRRHVLAASGLREKLIAAGVDPEAAKEAQIDAAAGARIAALLTPDDMDLTDAAQGAFIVAYVASWDADRPLPTMDTVDDLPGPVYDVLAKATTALGDGSVEVSPDGAVDAASPTVPSPASGPGEGDATSPSIPST